MEENKYYTPEAEELVLDLELERKDSTMILTSDPPQDLWVKEIIKGWTQTTDLFMNHTLRVKYLDKDDIDSMGFKYNKESSGHYSYIKEVWDRDNSEQYKLCYMFEDNPTSVVILKADKAWVMGTSKWKPIFQGTIKNKSELKKLLKQLGV